MSISRILVSLFGLALATSAVGCGVEGSGVAAEDRRSVPAFQGLRAKDSTGLVLLTIDASAANAKEIELIVSGDDNIVSEVETFVVDGVLEVRAKDGQTLNPTLPLRVSGTVPDLRALEASDSADVEVRGLHNDAFASQAYDSADIRLSGVTSSLTIATSDSADIDARDLEAKDVVIDSWDSSDVEVCAKDTLDIHAADNSDVTYWCSPAKVDKSASDSADVQAGR